MKQKIYKVDAFTNKIFGGNPAAVCILKNWIDEELMQNIAMENNLSETVFVVNQNNKFEIRWFAPLCEIALCGHATLAAAFVLFNYYNFNEKTINFHSHLSGNLFATNNNDESITLNFPTKNFEKIKAPDNLLKALNVKAINTAKSDEDYLIELQNESKILNCNPHFNLLTKVDCGGIIITAKGNKVDFVSRFFAPKIGINEDPVTGSAHCILTPYWSKKLNKTKFNAKQLSARTGNLICELLNKKVKITGNAKLFLIGEIYC